jgi:hypothetical protein
MSLRKSKPPPPPPPSWHVPHIADIGASLVEEATIMMKHRLAEHTLSTLAARIHEDFYQRTFYRWRQVPDPGESRPRSTLPSRAAAGYAQLAGYMHVVANH